MKVDFLISAFQNPKRSLRKGQSRKRKGEKQEESLRKFEFSIFAFRSVEKILRKGQFGKWKEESNKNEEPSVQDIA